MRWVGFAFGLLIVVFTAGSVIGTLVVPRRVKSVIAKACDAVVDLAFRVICPFRMSYPRRDATLAWQAPISLVFRLLVWLALLYAGYALMLLPVVSDNVGRAFSEAGSSMFTLGYSAPRGSGMTVLDYFAAFTGLIVVGLQIGYLPTLYAAFNRRETEVTLLVSRAGLPAWGPEMLARTRFGITDGAEVGPVLDPLVHHLGALVGRGGRVALDLPDPDPAALTAAAVALGHLAAGGDGRRRHAPGRQRLVPHPAISARLCLRMGFTAMRQVGAAMNLTVDEDPDPDQPLAAVTYEEFAAAVDMLRDLDYPVERSNEQAWPHFRGWRVNYEQIALALARATNAPPALWSGTRRWPSTPMPPGRPANRRSRDLDPTARSDPYDRTVAKGQRRRTGRGSTRPSRRRRVSGGPGGQFVVRPGSRPRPASARAAGPPSRRRPAPAAAAWTAGQSRSWRPSPTASSAPTSERTIE